MCTGGDEILPLMDAMSGAWVAFARTGNPNFDLLPVWPAYTPENPATMLFDTPCKVAVGHDQALLPLISKYSPVI